MTTNAPASSARPAVNPTEVGWQFVPQYYTFVNKNPHRLHCFYTKNSTFSHGTEGEDSKQCYGQHEIHAKIMSLGYENCKVFIHSVDAQSSANGGIIIQVVGEMSNKDEPWKKFVQTFFLAEQTNGYFVLNDIFRFLKEETAGEEEEGEDEAEAAEDLPTTTQVDEPQQDAQATISVEQAAAAYEPEQPVPVTVHHPVAAAPQVIDPEPVAESAPVDAPADDAGVNGVNGHSETVESVEETHEVPVPEVVEPEPQPEPATTAQEPPAPEAPVAVKVPTPAPASPAPEKQAPAPIPAPPQRPASPPAPPVPSGPKTWATLAASNKKGWGSAIAADAKGVSAAAPQSAAPSGPPKPVAPNGAQRSFGGDGHPAYQSAMAVTSAQCFVKSVTENVVEQIMRDHLTQRFGAIKELEIVRSKACAFLEFTTVEAARKAIVASLPPSQGGEGGIRLEGKPAGPNNLPPRIIVETRKERADRPPPRPRGGAPIGGEGRGAAIGGGPGEGRGGGPGGRGRGGPMRGRGTGTK